MWIDATECFMWRKRTDGRPERFMLKGPSDSNCGSLGPESIVQRSPGLPDLCRATLGRSNVKTSTLKGLCRSLNLPRESGITMSQSLSQIYLHVVFSTKER